jgi:hypothetical protein
MIRKCVFFPIVTFSEFPIYGHSRESWRHTPEFRGMRGWYQFAPHVRSRTQVIVPAG